MTYILVCIVGFALWVLTLIASAVAYELRGKSKIPLIVTMISCFGLFVLGYVTRTL